MDLSVFSETQWYKKIEKTDLTGMVKQSNPLFNPDNFNTTVPEKYKAEYDTWAKTNVTDSGMDYDYAGAFMERYQPGGQVWDRGSSGNGHLPDTYKKPNHPTFSTESKYATGIYSKFAGKWALGNAGLFIP